MSDFHEGNWLWNPDALCPDCGKVCIFASDLKAFGHHQVRVCKPCHAVYENGQKRGELEVFPEPK